MDKLDAVHVTDRFAKSWDQWDKSVRTRADIPRFLKEASDEDLVELLAGASKTDRKYERDIVATEILNRLGRRHRDLPAAAAEVLESAEAAYQAAAEGQRAIHMAEGILKATGQETLGAEVSASAFASLDTTKLAFEAAQQNSADVQAAVAQSRIAREFAEASVATAEAAQKATDDAAEHLEAAGHAEAAAEARLAADRMRETAEENVAATKAERSQTKD